MITCIYHKWILHFNIHYIFCYFMSFIYFCKTYYYITDINTFVQEHNVKVLPILEYTHSGALVKKSYHNKYNKPKTTDVKYFCFCLFVCFWQNTLVYTFLLALVALLMHISSHVTLTAHVSQPQAWLVIKTERTYKLSTQYIQTVTFKNTY